MFNNHKIIVERYGSEGIIFYPSFSENNLIHEFSCFVKNFAPYDLKRNKDFFSINGSTYCYGLFPTISKSKTYKNKDGLRLFKSMVYNALIAQEWADYFKSGRVGEEYDEEEQCIVGCMIYDKERPSKISIRKSVVEKTKKFLTSQVQYVSFGEEKINEYANINQSLSQPKKTSKQ